MAKKLTKAELDAYFNEIIREYSDSPLSAYFGEDVADIIERAQKGAKSGLKQQEKQEIYNELRLKVDGLSSKIDGCLEELKDNLSGKGATSPLAGTFYYRSTDGDSKASEIVSAADEAMRATTIAAKAEGFNKVAGLFADYVNTSTLVSNLDTTDNDNAKRNNVSLAKVYTNALSLEKHLGLRKEGSEIYKLLDNPSHAALRRDTAVPFKYYTILAGIKTGKIKTLTPAHIADLQWVYQNNPGLFPKNSPITNAALKENPDLQKQLLSTLKEQHDEKTIRETLIKYKKDLAENPDILAACMDNTKAFRVGLNTAGRNVGRSGIAGGIALGFIAIHVFSNVLVGMADPNFAKVFSQLFADGRIWNTILPLATGTSVVLGVNAVVGVKNREFAHKFNEVDRAKLMRYLTQNRAKWNNKEKRAEMVQYVNREFGNLLGDKPKVAERLLDVLFRGIDEQAKVANTRDRRAQRGEGVETVSITGKRDIEDFARNIGLSKDNPLSRMMTGVLSRLGVELPKHSVAFATTGERVTGVDEPVATVTTTVAEPRVDEFPTRTPAEQREEEIDNAISVLKSHINADAVTLDVAIGGVEYELSVKRTGPRGGKLNTRDLDAALGRVRGYLKDGVKSFTVDAETEQSKIPVIKNIKKPASVSISMTKKEPPANGSGPR